MKNRLLILLIIVAFILSAGSYVFIDQSPASTPDNVSASEYFSGYESKSGSSSPSVAPSSKNVSSSYYQQPNNWNPIYPSTPPTPLIFSGSPAYIRMDIKMKKLFSGTKSLLNSSLKTVRLISIS